ncbi:Arylsulfatase [Bacteroidales bacterium Barb7]|nr:Arylsulfatase [Bacteroidales bacterium Barb7]
MKKIYYKPALGAALLLCHNVNAQKESPNIVLVVVDDLGYSDLGVYGSEIHTPNLDRLASEGVRFRQFYNNSISAPTRASLLTGQYASKAGVGYFDVNLGLPAYQGYLNKESLTIAEVLRKGGYQTYLSGKWHVGKDNRNNERPAQRGFDRSFGILGGASTYLYNHDYEKGINPGPLFEDNAPVSYENEKDFYITDAITKHAVQYIGESSQKKSPFFLYLAYTAPHWPLQAKPEDIAKYKGHYDIGWDSLRTVRINKQKESGLIPKDFVPAIKDRDIPDWENLTYDEKHLWAKKMEVFAAMVDRVDQGVGEVLDALKKTNRIDNTIVVFISDNGAPAEEVNDLFGIYINSGTVGTAGSYESQSRSWSHVSNSPLRAYKTFAYEGGISSPFIAWYPSKISGGKLLKGQGHIIDLAPTFYDIAGVTYPREYNQVKPHPLAGVSLKNVLYNATELDDRPLFWERAGNRAVRAGNYKLVSIFPSYEWELYDIESDRGETKNIAAENAALVNQLSRLYFEWAKENDVVDFEKIKPKESLLKKVNGKGIDIF